jgi:malate dehydrogenase (oxaloacetate-decarboxylating)
MLNYSIIKDQHGQVSLHTPLRGKALLSIPALNKSTAFDERERHEFGLLGKLPDGVENLDTQVERVYQQYLSYDKLINRNRYLNRLLDYNQTLFYALVKKYSKEMLPVIYTPFVGTTVKLYNLRFMHPRGLYISYKNENHIDEILDNRSNPNVKLIVVTDGEAILGIGDQGVGGMAIPVAKLIVYSLFGGINPNHTLPIMLDVGTNNDTLLNDPLYLGWRHPRIGLNAYEPFMDKFIGAIQRKFPQAFLHFEDFGRETANLFLKKYQNQLACFNDDIQGTGIVALAAVIAAARKTQTRLSDQRIVIFGGGSAGMGVTECIYKALLQEGLSEEDAKARFWIVDRQGLLQNGMTNLTSAQAAFARTDVDAGERGLAEVVAAVKPTVLFGCSAQAGAFTEEMIRDLAKHIEHPAILPLSNPNERAEATPSDLIKWTEGRALIATGSPFEDVDYNGQTYVISQCNNYLAFPGIGLGMLAGQLNRLSDTMLTAASHALADFSHEHCPGLLPRVEQVEAASETIAIALMQAGKKEGVLGADSGRDLAELVKDTRWHPEYLPYYFEG